MALQQAINTIIAFFRSAEALAATTTWNKKNMMWNDISIAKNHRTLKFMVVQTIFALAYGISGFEGMGARKGKDGKIHIFMLSEHWKRFSKLCNYLGIPEVPFDLFKNALEGAVRANYKLFRNLKDNEFVYLRPLVFASSDVVGVWNNEDYIFSVFVSKRGVDFTERPHVLIETTRQFSHKNGPGFHKIAGNYSNRIPFEKMMRGKGYDHIGWTRLPEVSDNTTSRLFSELGTQNVFLVQSGLLITPELDGSFLDGKTRQAVIKLAETLQIPVFQKPVEVDALHEAVKTKKISAFFGTGTAAFGIMIAGAISFENEWIKYEMPKAGEGIDIVTTLSYKLRQAYYGELGEDWTYSITI